CEVSEGRQDPPTASGVFGRVDFQSAPVARSSNCERRQERSTRRFQQGCRRAAIRLAEPGTRATGEVQAARNGAPGSPQRENSRTELPRGDEEESRRSRLS